MERHSQLFHVFLIEGSLKIAYFTLISVPAGKYFGHRAQFSSFEPSRVFMLRASGTLGQAKNRLGRAELSGTRVPDLPLLITVKN